MATYTMSEFIEQHKLDVSPHDSVATKLIVKRLTELGYKKTKIRRHGGMEIVWSNERATNLEDLKKKLAGIAE